MPEIQVLYFTLEHFSKLFSWRQAIAQPVIPASFQLIIARASPYGPQEKTIELIKNCFASEFRLAGGEQGP